jgi:ATP-dependent DNA helicase RecG
MSNSLPINLTSLLEQRTIESERVEYKAGWNPESVLHTICAFANDFHNLGGGYVVLGVAEQNGRPVLPPQGLDPDQIDAILKELLHLGHQAIQPPFHPLTATYTVQGRIILVIWAPGGETRPYKAKVSLTPNARDWAYYIRRNSSTIRARGDDERELLGLAATVPFDDRYNQTAAVEDFSRRLIGEFLDDVGSDLAQEAPTLALEALGRQMNIIGGPSEAPFPKNVGLLFFNEMPHRFFPATQIDVVFFPDGPGGDRFEEKIFQGPLGQITREAITYIERNFLTETVIKHPDRSEAERFWNFPRVAIEEAIVNAVYHRSYEIREPVEVRIGPEDLVVLSFPGPDRSIRLDDLRIGRAVSRRYRNRRIGEFLKDLDLTEGRSTGVPKILRAMQANGSPLPEFETDEDRMYFLIRLPIHAQAEKPAMAGAPEVTPEVAPEVTPEVAPEVRLVMTLRGEMSRRELQEALELKDDEHFRKAYLLPALDQGLIEPTIPDKPTSSKQRYRLTASGRALQDQLNTSGGDGV